MIHEETGNWCWLGGILEKLDNKWEFWIDKDVTLMEFFKKECAQKFKNLSLIFLNLWRKNDFLFQFELLYFFYFNLVQDLNFWGEKRGLTVTISFVFIWKVKKCRYLKVQCYQSEAPRSRILRLYWRQFQALDPVDQMMMTKRYRWMLLVVVRL